MASVAEGKRKGFLSFFAQSRSDYSDIATLLMTTVKEVTFWPLLRDVETIPDDFSGPF